MKLVREFALTFGLSLIVPSLSIAQPIEVLFSCGASSGYGYYFTDPIFNPDGPNWTKDGMRNGSITLVSQGENLDIIFDDAARGHGYRSDGAEVVFLGGSDRYYRVGAFHQNYADIYTFDVLGKKVVWSSNKSGPLSSKVVVYEAVCR